MSEDKIGQWVEKVLRASNNPGDATGIVNELTNGPIIFSEKDFAEYLKKNHSKVPVKIKLEEGIAKIKVGYSIFHLTFPCSVEVDPDGKIVHLHLKKELPLKKFLKIEEQFHQLGFLSYDNPNKTISCDLTGIPQIAHLTEGVRLKVFKIRKEAVEVKLERYRVFTVQKKDIEIKVIEIINKQMGRSPKELTLQTSFINDLGADSLDVVELTEKCEDAFDVNIPDKDREKFQQIKDIVKCIEKQLIKKSRLPVFYLIGRSGHGKSSIVNALAKEEVAPVGDIEPTTPESIPYPVHLAGGYSELVLIDTRGIFETTRPDGAPVEDAAIFLRNDIKEWNPEVIMHVISAPEIRTLSEDLKVVKEISRDLKKHSGRVPPTIVVINKIDTHGNNPRGKWPPEKHAEKAALIKEALDYLTFEILKVHGRPIEPQSPAKGYLVPTKTSEISNNTYVAIIPVCALEAERWNVETLRGSVLKEVKIHYVRKKS